MRVPALDRGTFSSVTLDGMAEVAIEQATELAAAGPLLVVGSSLGAWLAAWLAADDRLPGLAALQLLAPAFGFIDRWSTILGDDGIAEWRSHGTRPFFCHATQREEPVSVALLDSCLDRPSVPGLPARAVPVSVVAGRDDQTAPYPPAEAWAQACPLARWHLVDDEHALINAASDAVIASELERLLAAIA